MKTKIYLCCFLFFAFSLSCWAQVKILDLPSEGVYDKPLELDDDTIKIFRKEQKFGEFNILNMKFEANFYNAKILNDTEFTGCIFQKKANFKYSKFQNSANFRFSTFQNIANFESSIFLRGSYFLKANFKDTTNFNFTSFGNNTSFNRVLFQKNAMFFSTTFNGDVDFMSAVFQNNAVFNFANFQNYAFFNETKFQNIVSFENSTFRRGANFGNCNFGSLSNFQSLKGKGELSFSYAQMSNVLNFQNIDSLKVDFRNAEIGLIQKRKFITGEKVLIYLYLTENHKHPLILSTKADSILFIQSQTLNKCIIQLKGTKLENIILPYIHYWVDTTNYTYEEKTSLYEKLIKVCKEEGMEESIEGWSIELKKIQNLRTGEFTLWSSHFTFAGKFYNWFQKIFWNFGFTKSYILRWIFILFVLFYLINLFIYPYLLRVYFNPKLGSNLFPSTPPDSAENLILALKKSRAIRFRYLLHYTGVIFFALKLEHTDVSFKHLRWVVVVYFQFVIGIVLLGFAINFILSK